MLYSLENEAAAFGLKINSGNSSTTDSVEEINQFTYLGNEICKDVGSDADAHCRVRKAKGAFGILSPIWRNS